MTAETDLLPITWADFWMSRGDTERAHDFESFSFADHYARACVSSATEALRAEVGQRRAEEARWASAARCHMAKWIAEQARAARLAEALRGMVGASYAVCTTIDPRGHRWSEAYLDQALLGARAALEQETTNG